MGSDDDDDDDDAATIRLNATLVTATLRQQCNSVPEWLEDPVYLDPAATLYMALLSVLVYTMHHRLSGLTVYPHQALKEGYFLFLFGKYELIIGFSFWKSILCNFGADLTVIWAARCFTTRY